MRFITSHQSIADIATFISFYLVPTFNLTLSSNKLVTFGGSYPGVLSAWARLRLPHLVHAAVASSAPVLAVADFVGYNNVVAHSFAYPLVGGSPACTANIAAAFVAIDAAFTGADSTRHAMATKLMSCTGLDGQNDTMWAASNYASIIMGIAQYNRDGPTGLNIRAVCATMTQPGIAPIDAFAQVVQKAQGTQCLDNAYADYVAQLSSTSVNKAAGGVGIRSWTWQTCVQFACELHKFGAKLQPEHAHLTFKK
jgi:serine protease 16